MSYSNGIITAPVSIDDIKSALGSSSNDLATLCKSSNVNIWSLMKPCDYNNMWQMVPYEDYGIPDETDSNKENIVMGSQVKTGVKYGTLGIVFPDLARYDDAAYGGTSTADTRNYSYYRSVPMGGNISL